MIVEGDDVRLVVRALLALERSWRVDGMPPPPEVVQLRRRAEREWAGREQTTGRVPIVDPAGSVVGWWPSGRAAERLGCSERNIVKLLHSGRLAGRQIEGRRWLVDPASIERYESAKAS